MDLLSFQIPVIGLSYFMSIKNIKFSFHNKNIYFYNTYPDQPMVCHLYRGVSHHQKIISFFEKNQHPHLLLKPMKKNKYSLSFHKNFENILVVINILKTLFSSDSIFLKISLSNNIQQYILPKCTFHLVDLYEMGYMSLQSVIFPSRFLFNLYETKIFTGIYLNARYPFHKYTYDYIDLNFSNSFQYQDYFLDISLDMTLQDRTELVSNITTLITNLLHTIPFNENKKTCQYLKKWKKNHEIEIYHYELNKKDWKPSPFLKALSHILDIFPSYSIQPRYNLEFSI